MSRRAVESRKNLDPDSVALVDRQRAPITADKYGAAGSRRRGDQCVVCGTAGHVVFGQTKNEILVGPCTESQERLRKSNAQEFADHLPGNPMWSRQARKHRVGLKRAVLDKAQAAIKHSSCARVILVPRRECGDHQAGVRRLQRRTRSIVSRTWSAVSAGRSASGTATTPLPRFCSRIGVEAISISSRPSPARISSGWPGLRPSACRRAFGTTIRPAVSMVAFMDEILP